MAPHPMPIQTQNDEAHLGELAMRFRGTRDDLERQSIAADYANTVERLIHSGAWDDMPPPEDQLPDDFMPKEFFDYWS